MSSGLSDPLMLCMLAVPAEFSVLYISFQLFTMFFLKGPSGVTAIELSIARGPMREELLKSNGVLSRTLLTRASGVERGLRLAVRIQRVHSSTVEPRPSPVI